MRVITAREQVELLSPWLKVGFSHELFLKDLVSNKFTSTKQQAFLDWLNESPKNYDKLFDLATEIHKPDWLTAQQHQKLGDLASAVMSAPAPKDGGLSVVPQWKYIKHKMQPWMKQQHAKSTLDIMKEKQKQKQQDLGDIQKLLQPTHVDPYAYPGASFAGMTPQEIGMLPSGFYESHYNSPGAKPTDVGLDPGVAAFLESKGYGPQELKNLPFDSGSVGDEPSQVKLMWDWSNLPQEAKQQFAEQESEGQNPGKPSAYAEGNDVEQHAEGKLPPGIMDPHGNFTPDFMEWAADLYDFDTASPVKEMHKWLDDPKERAQIVKDWSELAPDSAYLNDDEDEWKPDHLPGINDDEYDPDTQWPESDDENEAPKNHSAWDNENYNNFLEQSAHDNSIDLNQHSTFLKPEFQQWFNSMDLLHQKAFAKDPSSAIGYFQQDTTGGQQPSEVQQNWATMADKLTLGDDKEALLHDPAFQQWFDAQPHDKKFDYYWKFPMQAISDFKGSQQPSTKPKMPVNALELGQLYDVISPHGLPSTKKDTVNKWLQMDNLSGYLQNFYPHGLKMWQQQQEAGAQPPDIPSADWVNEHFQGSSAHKFTPEEWDAYAKAHPNSVAIQKWKEQKQQQGAGLTPDIIKQYFPNIPEYALKDWLQNGDVAAQKAKLEKSLEVSLVPEAQAKWQKIYDQVFGSGAPQQKQQGQPPGLSELQQQILHQLDPYKDSPTKHLVQSPQFAEWLETHAQNYGKNPYSGTVLSDYKKDHPDWNIQGQPVPPGFKQWLEAHPQWGGAGNAVEHYNKFTDTFKKKYIKNDPEFAAQFSQAFAEAAHAAIPDKINETKQLELAKKTPDQLQTMLQNTMIYPGLGQEGVDKLLALQNQFFPGGAWHAWKPGAQQQVSPHYQKMFDVINDVLKNQTGVWEDKTLAEMKSPQFLEWYNKQPESYKEKNADKPGWVWANYTAAYPDWKSHEQALPGMPSTSPSQGGAQYVPQPVGWKNLLQNAQHQNGGGMYTTEDWRIMRSPEFMDWFKKAPKDYQKVVEKNPAMALDDFSQHTYGWVPKGEPGEKPHHYDVTPYHLAPWSTGEGTAYFTPNQPVTVPGEWQGWTKNPPPTSGGSGRPHVDWPVAPPPSPGQLEIPLPGGSTWEPQHQPLQLHRGLNLSLDYSNNDPQQQALLAEIAHHLRGSSDKNLLDLFNTAPYEQDWKTGPYGKAPGQKYPHSPEDWMDFAQWAKGNNVPGEQMYDLAEQFGVTHPEKYGPPPLQSFPGGYHDPQLGHKILDYLENSKYQGAPGIGKHWSTSESVSKGSFTHAPSENNLPVLISADWPGLGEDPQRSDAAWGYPSEKEITLAPGAPIKVRRIQIKHPKTEQWIDLPIEPHHRYASADPIRLAYQEIQAAEQIVGV